jgi:hypothetical protein
MGDALEPPNTRPPLPLYYPDLNPQIASKAQDVENTFYFLENTFYFLENTFYRAST